VLLYEIHDYLLFSLNISKTAFMELPCFGSDKRLAFYRYLPGMRLHSLLSNRERNTNLLTYLHKTRGTYYTVDVHLAASVNSISRDAPNFEVRWKPSAIHVWIRPKKIWNHFLIQTLKTRYLV